MKPKPKTPLSYDPQVEAATVYDAACAHYPKDDVAVLRLGDCYIVGRWIPIVGERYLPSRDGMYAVLWTDKAPNRKAIEVFGEGASWQAAAFAAGVTMPGWQTARSDEAPPAVPIVVYPPGANA